MPDGRVTFSTDEPAKAYAPTFVPSGRVRDPAFRPGYAIKVFVLFSYRAPSLDSYTSFPLSTVISDALLSRNGFPAIDVSPAGIAMVRRDVSSKAHLPMEVTLMRSKVSRAVQLKNAVSGTASSFSALNPVIVLHSWNAPDPITVSSGNDSSPPIFEHDENARAPTEVSLGAVREARSLQPLNAFTPMAVSSGASMDAIFAPSVPSENALSPMLVMSAKSNVSRLVQPLNAEFPMVFMPGASSTAVSAVQSLNVFSFNSTMPAFTTASVNPLCWKAYPSIVVTLAGTTSFPAIFTS